MRWQVGVLPLSLLSFCISSTAPAQYPDARTLIEKSVRAEDESEARKLNYTFHSRNVLKELDGKGNVQSTKTTVEETLYLGGKPYVHLLEKDGKPLSGNELKKEQDKLDRAVAEAGKLTEEQKRARLEKELQNRHKEMERRSYIPQAYDLSVVREESLNGRPAWVIHAEPRPSYNGKYAALLKNLAGEIWIDESDFHWAKVSARALENFSLGLFLARISKDTRINFELTRVNDEVWLPKFVSVRAEARLALLKKVNVDQEIYFSDYRKYSSDSRIVSTSEQ